MVKQELVIGHLYPREMNIYGDTGNVVVLEQRLKRRSIGARVKHIGVGDELPDNLDIIVSGGGQDAGQLSVQEDLQHKSSTLHKLVNDGVVMLVICGTYQLFGKQFITASGTEIKGVGIFDMETRATGDRLIGNVVIDSPWGRLVGYENHSGRTYLENGQSPLGRVVSGAGNNNEDGFEGAIRRNVFGSYLHGPILPKNPRLADELIGRAMKRKYGTDQLTGLDDWLAYSAAERAADRPR